MEILNPFEADNAFNVADLSMAIQMLPNNYGRMRELNVFPGKGVTQRTILVEENNGVLNLLPTRPVGAPGTENRMGKRKVRSFVIPHIPLDDVIRPEEFSGVREFGQSSATKTLQTVMNDHLQTGRNKFGITIEHLRMGALKGSILDADGSELYNLFTEFGVSENTVDFALATTTTNIAAKCRAVLRLVEDNLKGETMSEVRCLVDATFFDAFIGHANVEKFYVNWQAAAAIAGKDPRKGFSFGGITWEEYRGQATDMDGNTRLFLASKTGRAFPMGTMDTFRTFYAPADFLETVNTVGQEIYAKQAMEKMGRWVDVHMQSNALPICARPSVLVKVYSSN
ncbi:MAG: major capsid protein [Smithella sp.]